MKITKMNRLKLNIFLVLLILLILLSIIPIAILINQSIDNLDIIKGVSKEAIGAIVREQSDQVYKSSTGSGTKNLGFPESF